jgi:hypothetical protein
VVVGEVGERVAAVEVREGDGGTAVVVAALVGEGADEVGAVVEVGPAAVDAAGAEVGALGDEHAASARQAPRAVMRRGRPFMVRR